MEESSVYHVEESIPKRENEQLPSPEIPAENCLVKPAEISIFSALPARIFKPTGAFLDSGKRREAFLKSQRSHRNRLLDNKRNALNLHIEEALNYPENHTDVTWDHIPVETSVYSENRKNDVAVPHSMSCDRGFLDMEGNFRNNPGENTDDTFSFQWTGFQAEGDFSENLHVIGENSCDVNKRNHFRRKINPQKLYGKQLVLYDWLVTIPDDIGKNWFFFLRPEGKRCLLSIFNQYAIARDKFGVKFDGFPCQLPGHGFTIIECVFDGSARVFYICDLLVWNDCSLFNSSLECRWFFIESRFTEVSDFISKATRDNPYPMHLLEYRECGVQSLQAAYYCNTSFTTDSLVFVHKEAHYIAGFSPLWLCWRDAHLSRYSVDTHAMFTGDNSVDQDQIICLELMPSGKLRTADGAIVGKVDPPCSINKKKIRHSMLVRGKISGVNLQTYELQNLCIIGRPSHGRIFAEPLNRIVAQHIQRMAEPVLKFEDILIAVANSS
ncbi:hypothetical protein IE077_001923 [Cardiosporidium cionae]|uniref:Snurportin-1 n=1 Tax=Cardiosporidium cionae TaxID=476202 RepID=A0ABQ7JBZ7_9APIC|nr:hypothetical protein IE077_001923 [Cardiosporidium cionae]|eukprot:KAF8821532.1 hypothetical protein IE077_001923 [Cardiosporidium cionae]